MAGSCRAAMIWSNAELSRTVQQKFLCGVQLSLIHTARSDLGILPILATSDRLFHSVFSLLRDSVHPCDS